MGDLLREAEVTGSSVYRNAAAVKTPGFRSVIVLMVSGATIRLVNIFGSWAVFCVLSHNQVERVLFGESCGPNWVGVDGRVQMSMRWPMSLEVSALAQILSLLSGQPEALGRKVCLSAGDVQQSTTHTTRDMSDGDKAL